MVEGFDFNPVTAGGRFVLGGAFDALFGPDEGNKSTRAKVLSRSGYTVFPIDPTLPLTHPRNTIFGLRPAKLIGGAVLEPKVIIEELPEVVTFPIPRAPELPESFKKFAEAILNPTYIPGQPCIAQTPLLKDLLDVILGREGVRLGEIFQEARQTVEDLILPAEGTVQEITDAVEAVLDDPITAALNMVLGQKAKIDCETDASLGFGFGTIVRGVEKLEKAIEELLF
jgi:hypothetical protein